MVSQRTERSSPVNLVVHILVAYKQQIEFFVLFETINVSNHLRATEEWLQTSAQTLQYLFSCLLSISAKNAEM